MKKPEISIIIPVFNGEEYLYCSIESILAQTYGDFELLLIDDGSNDNSLIICDEYSRKDQRVRVYSKSNGGVSSARNYGLELTRGEMIVFVDVDDCLEKDYLQRLIDYKDFDLVIGGYKEFGNKDDLKPIKMYYEIDLAKTTSAELDFNIKYHSENIIFYYVWGKIFKAEIIRKNNLRFNMNIRLCEDTCFVIDFLSYSKKIVLIPFNNYLYRKIDTIRKYSMGYDDYNHHQLVLNNHICRLENLLCFNLSRTSSVLNKFLFSRFLENVKQLSQLTNFSKELSLFRNKMTHSLFYYIDTPLNFGSSILTFVIVYFPVLGYQLLKIKKTILK